MIYGCPYIPYLLSFGSQGAWLVGLELIMNFVPGGSRRVALKSKCPLRKACVDSFGLDLAALSKFNVKNDWSRR